MSWGVWKNVESALTGFSDVDSVADPSEHHLIERDFADWAAQNHLLPIILCRHLPGSLLLVACAPGGRLVELHLLHKAVLRGACLFGADQLRSMMVQDPRGFRRLRSGSEGFLLFFHNGVTKTGSPNRRSLAEKKILDMTREDPEGADAAAGVFGAGKRYARRAVSRAENGEWDRASVLVVEFLLALRALRSPSLLASRIGFRVAGAAYCPVLKSLQRGRRVDTEREKWLEAVGRTHVVIDNVSPQEPLDGGREQR